MSNLYTLTAKIHKLLPQIKAKYGLKFEVTGVYVITNNNEILHKYQIPFDEQGHCKLIDFEIAIQAPQLRQILVGLQEVLGMTESDNLLICPHCGYQAEWHEFDGNPYGNYDKCPKCYKVIEDRDYMEYVKDKPQVEALDDKWFRPIEKDGKYTGQCMFDVEPITVYQELIKISENLLN